MSYRFPFNLQQNPLASPALRAAALEKRGTLTFGVPPDCDRSVPKTFRVVVMNGVQQRVERAKRML